MVIKFQGLDQLPTPQSFERQKTQIISGVYFLFNGNQLVYVGQSVNIFSRVHNHSFEKAKKFTNFAYLPCKKKFMNEIEEFYIYKFQPRYNIRLKGKDGWINVMERKKNA